eukprot:gnl/Dysnectes_brevis/7763_a13341_170.p1 GENE.gnl/Dysnectes_brevis/7763_a13341_170~~gnl/Dysnectes_brevis/7763_a13341_170.p1  ORF type:complete len:259 (+),score=55.67 gnl/Dysnectes_brevis/7763_a13341_170:23-778(+)
MVDIPPRVDISSTSIQIPVDREELLIEKPPPIQKSRTVEKLLEKAAETRKGQIVEQPRFLAQGPQLSVREKESYDVIISKLAERRSRSIAVREQLWRRRTLTHMQERFDLRADAEEAKDESLALAARSSQAVRERERMALLKERDLQAAKDMRREGEAARIEAEGLAAATAAVLEDHRQAAETKRALQERINASKEAHADMRQRAAADRAHAKAVAAEIASRRCAGITAREDQLKAKHARWLERMKQKSVK